MIEHRFENYAQQRNVALGSIDAEWILFVDADERATPELAKEARLAVDKCEYNGWWVPRHNYIMGHRMRATGWYPDYQMRLLRRSSAHYDEERRVHELVVLEGNAGHLGSPLIHYNYETLKQFLRKQHRYLDYDVSILKASGVTPHLYTPYTQAARHFWWRFVTLQGWRDTAWGVLLSVSMAYYELIKYRRVRQALRSGDNPAPAS